MPSTESRPASALSEDDEAKQEKVEVTVRRTNGTVDVYRVRRGSAILAPCPSSGTDAV